MLLFYDSDELNWTIGFRNLLLIQLRAFVNAFSFFIGVSLDHAEQQDQKLLLSGILERNLKIRNKFQKGAHVFQTPHPYAFL